MRTCIKTHAYKISAIFISLLLIASTVVVVHSDKADADNVYTFTSQYDFLDSAFTMTNRQWSAPELEWTAGGWYWQYIDGSTSMLRYHTNGYYDNWYPLHASIFFRNVGVVNGRWLNARITVSDLVGMNYAWNGNNYTGVKFFDFWSGMTMYGTARFNAEFAFYYADTGELMPMTGAWLTYGSVSKEEGIRYNAPGPIECAVLANTYLSKVGEGHWVGFDNGPDDLVGQGSYAMNAVSFRAKGPTMSMTFTSEFASMWTYPFFTPLVNVRPGYPEKICEVLD